MPISGTVKTAPYLRTKDKERQDKDKIRSLLDDDECDMVSTYLYKTKRGAFHVTHGRHTADIDIDIDHTAVEVLAICLIPSCHVVLPPISSCHPTGGGAKCSDSDSSTEE